jgi:L-fuconolactonase
VSEAPACAVDAHIHLWDLSTGWYRHIQAADESVGLGNPAGLKRNYLLSDYRRDTARYPIRKLVHVSAAFPKVGPPAETAWLDNLANDCGYEVAIVGTLDLRQGLDGVRAQLDAQRRSARFRGVRVTLGMPFESRLGAGVFNLLAEYGLLYEVGIHPHTTIPSATRAAAANPSVPFVLEHMGLAPGADALGDFARWKREITDFAALPTTTCKISGVAISVHRFDVEVARPFVKHCLDVFGAGRCMFGSNFPVDALYGSFDELWAMYETLAADLGDRERVELFGGTAEGVYGLGGSAA